MTPVEELRAAAALMRKRAEATAAPHYPYSDRRMQLVETTADWSLEINDYLGSEMGEHAASWHPAVALAVAYWLEHQATIWEHPGFVEDAMVHHPSFAVARAYLGEA